MRKIKSYCLTFIFSSFLLPSVGFCAGVEVHGLPLESMIDIIAILGFITLGIFMGSDPKVRNHRFFRILLFGCCLQLTGCATMEKSILFGAGMGAAAGMGVGVLVEKSSGSALLGAALGAVLSGGVAFLIHKTKDDEQSRLRLLEHKTNGENDPEVTSPEIRRVWVPESIDGTTFTAGHWKFLIERASVWTR